MDNRAIGVFDSGLGGLTAVSALRRLMPKEDIVYLGDTARVPYGDKSSQQLISFAEQDIAFLLSQNVKLILIACGTVSSTLSEAAMGAFAVPVIGVLNPAVDAAIKKSKNGKIGIIATAASIKTGAYRSKLLQKKPSAEVFEMACPRLVPLIESGRVCEADPEVTEAVNMYIPPLKAEGIDTLILGCTHYPLLRAAIRACLPAAEFIDVGKEAAERAKEIILKNGIEADRESGKCSFFVSGEIESFKTNASRFLGFDVTDVRHAELF